jgi:hypothetical protein
VALQRLEFGIAGSNAQLRRAPSGSDGDFGQYQSRNYLALPKMRMKSNHLTGRTTFVPVQKAPHRKRLWKAPFRKRPACPRTALFRHSDRPNLELLVVEQICFEAGGPCAYSGRNMEENHAEFGLTHKDFDACVEDLIMGMEDVGLT